MREITLLESNLARLQLSIILLIVSCAFHMYVVSIALLLATLWYAQKTFGEL